MREGRRNLPWPALRGCVGSYNKAAPFVLVDREEATYTVEPFDVHMCVPVRARVHACKPEQMVLLENSLLSF